MVPSHQGGYDIFFFFNLDIIGRGCPWRQRPSLSFFLETTISEVMIADPLLCTAQYLVSTHTISHKHVESYWALLYHRLNPHSNLLMFKRVFVRVCVCVYVYIDMYTCVSLRV